MILVGHVLRALGVLLMGVGFLLFPAAFAFRHIDFLARLALASGAAVSGRLGVASVKLGKKFQAAASRRAAATDARPPVLYLRSFTADETTSKGMKSPHPFVEELSCTEEEQMTKAIGDIGPVIAVGRPGEHLPTLGASRVYVDDRSWKSTVAQYMKKAQLVIIRIGATHGLMWEVHEAIHRVKPRRLVFLVPSVQSEYDSFKDATQGLLPCTLPDYPEGAKTPPLPGSIRGLICFEDDWSPRIIALCRPPVLRAQHQALVPMFRFAFRTLFDQIGVSWSPPGLNWYLICVVGLICLLIILAVRMVWA
jgi:hypothetical protein